MQSAPSTTKENYLRAFKRFYGENNRITAYLFSEVASTMDLVAPALRGELAADACFLEGSPGSPVLIFCLRQTQGRGQKGRSWVSEEAQGMYLSLALRPDRPESANLSGLSLSIGLGIHRALKELGIETQLKWPNDVLSKESPPKKLAGVLVEASSQGGTLSMLGVGVGLNVNQSNFPEGLPATSMARLHGASFSLPDVSAQVSLAVLNIIEEHLDKGLEHFRDSWWEASLGSSFLVDSSEAQGACRVLGISDKGLLRLQELASGREFELLSGEISVDFAKESTHW